MASNPATAAEIIRDLKTLQSQARSGGFDSLPLGLCPASLGTIRGHGAWSALNAQTMGCQSLELDEVFRSKLNRIIDSKLRLVRPSIPKHEAKKNT